MIYRRTKRFKESFEALPIEIKEKAIKAFSLFKVNKDHPSLVIKKMKGKENVWEGRIDISYRFTFHFEHDRETGDTTCVFRNIGPHGVLGRSA